jgi:hypothetical protein
MNKRIKQLARQACITIVPEPFDVASRSWNNNMEKFAELIVKECAAEADKCAARGSWMAGYRIKQHFGVKE